jgi:hypothetical protein
MQQVTFQGRKKRRKKDNKTTHTQRCSKIESLENYFSPTQSHTHTHTPSPRTSSSCRAVAPRVHLVDHKHLFYTSPQLKTPVLQLPIPRGGTQTFLIRPTSYTNMIYIQIYEYVAPYVHTSVIVCPPTCRDAC